MVHKDAGMLAEAQAILKNADDVIRTADRHLADLDRYAWNKAVEQRQVEKRIRKLEINADIQRRAVMPGPSKIAGIMELPAHPNRKARRGTS